MALCHCHFTFKGHINNLNPKFRLHLSHYVYLNVAGHYFVVID